MPLAFITPLTPSGMRYAHSATPIGFVAAAANSLWWREDCPASSEVSATRTRPCSLIVSTRAGTTFYRSLAGRNPSTERQREREDIPKDSTDISAPWNYYSARCAQIPWWTWMLARYYRHPATTQYHEPNHGLDPGHCIGERDLGPISTAVT